VTCAYFDGIEVNPPAAASPSDVEGLRQQLHQRLDEIIAFCLHDPGPASFLDFETSLLGLLRTLGCLLCQLFLLARHARVDLTPWTQTRGYRVAKPDAERTLEGRSSTAGPTSCPATVAGPVCTRWTSRWA